MVKIMKPELIIFDMDGLMIDTEPTSKEGWRLGLMHHGHEMSEDLFIQMLGTTLTSVKKLLCAHFGPDFDFDSVHKIRTDYFVSHNEKYGIPMKKGLLHILNRIDELGLKKCVATSTEWDSMEKKLKGLDLLSRFDGFVTGDQVSAGKPNPEIFLKAAQLIGVDPGVCVVLEDSIAGVTAGHAAGMRVVMVPDIVQPDQDTLKKIYAKCVDLEEVSEVLTRDFFAHTNPC